MESSSAQGPQARHVTESATAAVLFLLAETAVHAGTGSGTPVIDSPIQRSVHTRWPVLWDATLKGGLREDCVQRKANELSRASDMTGQREACLREGEKLADALFGKQDSPGPLSAPDAELLLFPVASAKGMTAWITCREALEYFARRLRLFEDALSPAAKVEVERLVKAVDALHKLPNGGFVPSGSAITWNGTSVILESDSHPVTAAEAADHPVNTIAAWLRDSLPSTKYWRDRLRTHLVIIDDDAFTHYVRHKTDNRPRVKISKGVVEHGPWTEENIPIDALLYTVVSASRSDPRHAGLTGHPLVTFVESLNLESQEPVIRIGGNQSLGRGALRVRALRPRVAGEP